jgi:hypothetical protein
MKPSDTPQWRKRWKIDNARGIKRLVPAAPAQAHVQHLVQRQGLSIRGIAEAAGVSPHMVSCLNRGLKPGLRRDSEKAILAVTAESVLARPNGEGFVPNIGGRRRIQALMAMGWRHQDLTPLLGINTGNIIHQEGGWFTKRKHDAIKDLYDRLWDKRGPATTLSINRVVKAGYAPPLAWDDDTIDDPNARPDLGARVYAQGIAPEGAIRHADAVVEDVEFLLSAGSTWHEILDRLNTSPDALEKILYRAHRGDLVSRAKTMNERQAYARAS